MALSLFRYLFEGKNSVIAKQLLPVEKMFENIYMLYSTSRLFCYYYVLSLRNATFHIIISAERGDILNTTEISNRIKYARDIRDVTLDDIAHKVGVAKSTIQRYEAGKIKNPKLHVVDSIAKALNVNPQWLIGKSDDMEIVKEISSTDKFPHALMNSDTMQSLIEEFGKPKIKISF